MVSGGTNDGIGDDEDNNGHDEGRGGTLIHWILEVFSCRRRRGGNRPLQIGSIAAAVLFAIFPCLFRGFAWIVFRSTITEADVTKIRNESDPDAKKKWWQERPCLAVDNVRNQRLTNLSKTAFDGGIYAGIVGTSWMDIFVGCTFLVTAFFLVLAFVRLGVWANKRDVLLLLLNSSFCY